LKPVLSKNLKHESIPLSVQKKNIGDCIRRQEEAICNPVDPPLFWLDNFVKWTLEILQNLNYIATRETREGLPMLTVELRQIVTQGVHMKGVLLLRARIGLEAGLKVLSLPVGCDSPLQIL
jgi:hypothetical protein